MNYCGECDVDRVKFRRKSKRRTIFTYKFSMQPLLANPIVTMLSSWQPIVKSQPHFNGLATTGISQGIYTCTMPFCRLPCIPYSRRCLHIGSNKIMKSCRKIAYMSGQAYSSVIADMSRMEYYKRLQCSRTHSPVLHIHVHMPRSKRERLLTYLQSRRSKVSRIMMNISKMFVIGL